MAKEEDVPTKYRHRNLRRIPVLSEVIPELKETREQARARRSGERLERLEEVKVQSLESSYASQAAQDKAKALAEAIKTERMRG